jgi:hypothetical protein
MRTGTGTYTPVLVFDRVGDPFCSALKGIKLLSADCEIKRHWLPYRMKSRLRYGKSAIDCIVNGYF